MGRVTRILQATAQQATERSSADARSGQTDHDLARVMASWPTLPKHIKRTILTLITVSAIHEE